MSTPVQPMVSHPSQYPGIETRDVQRAIGKQCLRELWRIYDLGGQSRGRSLEADLLEHGMHLLFDDTEHSTGRMPDEKLLALAHEACRLFSAAKAHEFRDKAGMPY